MTSSIKAYLAGSGIGSLAAAAFMIRDAAVPGKNILIFENGHLAGGSLDAAGDSSNGYSLRGGRMFTSDNYECTWDLFRSIPSLQTPGKSVDLDTVKSATCLPCRMPYITSQFMPRLHGDRPLPVPPNSKNLAFVSQFVEIASGCGDRGLQIAREVPGGGGS
jgi:myosin-crossreactive antigen